MKRRVIRYLLRLDLCAALWLVASIMVLLFVSRVTFYAAI